MSFRARRRGCKLLGVLVEYVELSAFLLEPLSHLHDRLAKAILSPFSSMLSGISCAEANAPNAVGWTGLRSVNSSYLEEDICPICLTSTSSRSPVASNSFAISG